MGFLPENPLAAGVGRDGDYQPMGSHAIERTFVILFLSARPPSSHSSLERRSPGVRNHLRFVWQTPFAATLALAFLIALLPGCGNREGNHAGDTETKRSGRNGADDSQRTRGDRDDWDDGRDGAGEESVVILPVDYTPPAQSGYVGDAACVDCHQEISDSFSGHPMSQSIVPVDLEAEKRRMGGTEAVVGPPNHHYLIEADGNTLWHRERMLDSEGDVIFEEGKPVQYAVGSGQRAVAYLAHRDDLLFMSPLNWYSEAGIYDFAPTHSVNDSRRFDRRAGADCLSCHAGRVNELDRSGSQYGSPPFHQMAIGCENCHGPGEAHVQFQTEGALSVDASTSDPIVNPGDLDHQRREAVCYQCHLHATARVLRPERSHFDFRPGDRLEKVWAMLVKEGTITAEGTTEAVNHVQQMHASRCYRESDGRLGCISCHDPHGTPGVDQRVSFYRDRCLACHTVSACAGNSSDREAVDDSCIECHMPSRTTHRISHTSQTDHRIIRPENLPFRDLTTPDRRRGEPERTTSDPFSDLRFLWDTGSRLPVWERRRTRGIALWLSGSHAESRPPMEIVDQLGPIARQRPEDGPVQTVLGAFWMQHQSPDRARLFYEAALEDSDVRETAVGNLLTIYYLAAQWDTALEFSQEMLDIDPENARVHSLRADIFANLGQPEKAIEAAEVALRLNPTLVPVRQYLIGLYQRSGASEEAERHQQFLQRMQSSGRHRKVDPRSP